MIPIEQFELLVKPVMSPVSVSLLWVKQAVTDGRLSADNPCDTDCVCEIERQSLALLWELAQLLGEEHEVARHFGGEIADFARTAAQQGFKGLDE